MITSKDPTAVGVYEDLAQAERTMAQLKRAGFREDEISIIGNAAEEAQGSAAPQLQAPEDNAIHGLLKGAALGAIIGALVILAIPGLGAVSGMGWGFEILGGALLGAVAAGVLIAFSTFIFMRPTTRLYAQEEERGNFIVTVANPNRQQEAISVLQRTGGRAD